MAIIERTEETELHREDDLLSEENIARYKEGCDSVAVAIDSVVDRVLKVGKRPTILIPSRGAFPISLLALNALADWDREGGVLHTDGIFSDPNKVNYYPDSIFKYLSIGQLGGGGISNAAIVDVILYPFTADVLPVEGTVSPENIARCVRKSAASAFLKLSLDRNRKELDLDWYFFLMTKLKPQGRPQSIDPQKTVTALKSIKADSKRQIIILDTVISGRAAFDITHAFKSLGHPVIPILSVDNYPAKLKGELKAQIIANTKSAWLPLGFDVSDLFIEFPLVSEDAGASLLGVTALDFANFNRDNIFHRVNDTFPNGFMPQSCVWWLPPGNEGIVYFDAFRDFIGECSGRNVSDWHSWKEGIWKLRSHRGPISQREFRSLVKGVSTAETTETSSHIISINLPPQTATNWVKEFASS